MVRPRKVRPAPWPLKSQTLTRRVSSHQYILGHLIASPFEPSLYLWSGRYIIPAHTGCHQSQIGSFVKSSLIRWLTHRFNFASSGLSRPNPYMRANSNNPLRCVMPADLSQALDYLLVGSHQTGTPSGHQFGVNSGWVSTVSYRGKAIYPMPISWAMSLEKECVVIRHTAGFAYS